MNVWDQFKAKYATFDTSGKLITVIFFTTLVGWLLFYVYRPAYLQLALPNGFLPAFLQPWSWLTHAFMHNGLFHFIGNAFGIHIAGRYILNIFKGRQFLTLFFLGVLIAATTTVVASGLFPVFFEVPKYATGASAGVFALVFFACAYFPESEFRLIFVNIKLKYFAYFFLASNLVMFALQINTVGSLAHLAGAAVGYYAATRMRNGIDVLEGFSKTGDYIVNLFKSSPKKPKSQRKAKMKTVYKGKTSPSKSSKTAATDQAKIDAILDKISSSGYESLSKAEKDYLFKAGNDK